MGTSPCKNCSGRYVGCHSECESYHKMLAEKDKIKKARNEAYELDYACHKVTSNGLKEYRRSNKRRNRR